jgi:protein-S-isoprenylcysteine O-methyltransferase Ste14
MRELSGLPRSLQLLIRVPVPWVFVLVYFWGVGLHLLFPWSITASRQASIFVGVILFAAGIFIASWSLMIFRRAQTTTTPGEISATLVTWGPYRFSRNPMYLALTLAYLGEAGILVQLWPLVTLSLMLVYVQWVVIPLEETRLRGKFGQQYEDYVLRVRRWI